MKRLPVVLSAAALAVAVLGATPLGHAAGQVISTIPPFAKRANHANVAENALRLNGRKSSVTGGPGTIPVLDAKGKLPAAVGAVGPKGDRGDKGDPATKLFALVKPNGSLGASQGVTASVRDTSAGGYQITFGQDVTFCAVVATAGLKDRFTTAQVNPFGRGGNTVRVVVQDGAGSFLYDTDFSIAAFC